VTLDLPHELWFETEFLGAACPQSYLTDTAIVLQCETIAASSFGKELELIQALMVILPVSRTRWNGPHRYTPSSRRN